MAKAKKLAEEKKKLEEIAKAKKLAEERKKQEEQAKADAAKKLLEE